VGVRHEPTDGQPQEEVEHPHPTTLHHKRQAPNQVTTLIQVGPNQAASLCQTARAASGDRQTWTYLTVLGVRGQQQYEDAQDSSNTRVIGVGEGGGCEAVGTSPYHASRASGGVGGCWRLVGLVRLQLPGHGGALVYKL
jgi:hypothetical protein